jgi:sec-independent protein translocase protein TatC
MTIGSSTESRAASIAPAGPEDSGQMTFFEHLVELRKRIINSAVSIAAGAAVGWVVAPHFINWITAPMLHALGKAHLEQKLVYTNPTGYLNLLITLSIYLGIVMASPWVLYQVWLFVAPALYKRERKAVAGFLLPTVLLFLGGIAFGYFIMLPHILDFLVSFQGPVVPLISINEYFDLVLMVLLGLGLVFEMPVLIFFLSLFGIVTPQFLIRNSKYAILVISIIAAIVTPTPDALTMLIFMAPMLGLYFASVGVSWLVIRGKRQQAQASLQNGDAR